MKSETGGLIKVLRWVSAITTVVYLVAFFWKLSSRYNMVQTTGLDIEWAVPTNPQSMIALCLATATVALLFLHSGGRTLSLILFLAVAGFYIQWYVLTDSIRHNIGVTNIPQAGWIGNRWVGADKLDLAVLGVVGFLVVGNAIALWKELRRKLNREQSQPPQPDQRHARIA